MFAAGRRPVLVAATLLALITACSPASDRPLRGAVPGTSPPTPPGLPPTLVASDALRPRGAASVPSPSPGVAEAEPSPSPAVAEPSPGATSVPSPSVVAAPPIVRTIVPSANGHVAGGPVTLSAVLVGRGADLESASLSADGADAGAQIDKRSPRDWTIHATQKLSDGPHTVRVLVRDTSGLAGGFTWQITVGEPAPQPAQPAPAASPKPAE
ncbi:MAG: hypothetical protein JO352_11255 [Chloroflexi bacterium]|nr:hypothetical protein [Chloroflexota bacterium]MBV9595796.1 hypothetical protein [Chloroflexota bacterium]